MKQRHGLYLILSLLMMSLLTACNNSPDTHKRKEAVPTQSIQENDGIEETASAYKKLSAADAKIMMDLSQDVIILDVRTQEEYDSGHIDGALLLPDTDINEKAEDLLSDKSATILVYCRSGRRSAAAAQNLADMGYTDVYDFGGIIDWPYDTVD